MGLKVGSIVHFHDVRDISVPLAAVVTYIHPENDPEQPRHLVNLLLFMPSPLAPAPIEPRAGVPFNSSIEPEPNTWSFISDDE